MNTAAAISTPYGRGGIAVIRIVGDEAFSIADRVFKTASGVLPSKLEPNFLCYGHIYAGEELIDEGMIVRFAAPRSYTGEDTVEISCHGGIFVSHKVLEAVYVAGALPAGPGEFTKRAFMNGKLSLSQAEAVIRVIDAETNDSLRLALSHANGSLKNKIDEIYNSLAALISRAYVTTDYPEEDLSTLSAEEMKKTLYDVQGELEALYGTYKSARIINEGIYTVIAGKPNTGKSSLFNLLLDRERAIVSDIEGTTRDFIEDRATLDGVLFKLCDTAGIRDGSDTLEAAGIGRSLEIINKAELILAVFDGSAPCDERDIKIIKELKKVSCPKIALLNKSDLGTKFTLELSSFDRVIRTNTLSKEGIGELRRALSDMFGSGKIDYSQPHIANARQAASILAAKEALGRAIDALDAGYTEDIAGLDIEEALARLGECDGRAVSEDVVERIFHNFCVGK